MISSKATSPQQGGVALLWEEGHQDFEVEAVTIVSPNLLTFQLVIVEGREERYFVMGAYIPPGDTKGVDDLRTAWAACPTNCKPLMLGDFNIDFRNPRTEREEIITEFLDKINVVDTSRKFIQCKGRRQGPGARWTWRQRRGEGGTTPSQIILWPGRWTRRHFGVWAIDSRGSTIRTIMLLLPIL
jgi:hypothetical protein